MTRMRAALRPQTVLLVDDESPWLDAVKMAVEGEKFHVITANSAEAALRQLRRKIPDLILSDVRMPEMNGFDLYEKIRKDPKFRNIPYVFMSSIDDFDAKHTAKQLGADDYVEKPIDTETVKKIVLNLLMRFKK